MILADSILWISFWIVLIVAVTGALSWWLARNSEPVDELRELRDERNGDGG